MQTIAVIAANGRSGQAFTRRALEAGLTIQAGVRGAHSLPTHERMTVVDCDATNEAQVRTLLEGADAVVSFIGHGKGSPAWVQTDATRVVTKVMQELGLRRIVSLTGTGVRVPGDHIPLADHLSTLGVRVFDPARMNDGIEHYEVLKASGLDWTVLRVMKLQNVQPRGYTLKLHGPTKWYVSRIDVANAALEVLQDDTFIQQAPILS